MKISGLSLLVLLLSTGSSFAGSRPFTPALSCRAVSSMVQRSGAVLLSTGPGLFDRYVTGQSQCASGYALVPSWVKSADNSACFVGYTCGYPEY